MTKGTRGRRLTPLPALPPGGLTLPELRIVARLQTLYEEVQRLRRPSNEPDPDGPGLSVVNEYRAQARAWVEAAAEKHLRGPQRSALRAYKDQLESWLTVLILYVVIGGELARPELRGRVAQWATVKDALAKAPARTKNRWIKRRSRPATCPPGAHLYQLRTAAEVMDDVTRCLLLERETDELSGANWATALDGAVDALIEDLGALRVPPRFILCLLADLQILPGCPRLPTEAAVKKRLQRLRKNL
jgi:hypothetical protein